MAEHKKEDEDARNWLKNAEEHGRMSEQIVKLTVQLDALTKIADKLTEGQKDLRAELVGDIKETNARLDKLRENLTVELKEANARDDKLREDFTVERKEANARDDKLREELMGELRETNARIDKLREELMGKLKETNDRLEESIARLAKQGEKDKKEIKNENRWFLGTILAVLVIMFAVLALMSGG